LQDYALKGEQEKMSVRFAKHWFTASEYERMGEACILPANERFELIEGEIIKMAPIGKRHAACVNRLSRILNRQASSTIIVSTQNPIVLDDFSEPQPDVALLKFREDFYEHALPQSTDVLLVIEVSDTTLDYDRKIKLSSYAHASIAEVWIVNLPEEIIETYAQPANGTYEHTRLLKHGETFTSETVPDLKISVDDVLG